MEAMDASSYLIIAAMSAENAHEGFLKRPAADRYLPIDYSPGRRF